MVLRGWLLEPERLSAEERKAAHKAGGDFLRDLEEQDREEELGLLWIDCLLEARAQFLAAGSNDEARAVTYRLNNFFVRQGLYEELVELNSDLLTYEEHPGPMNWIGRAYTDQSNYPKARKWYQRCLTSSGENRPKEAAAAWHGLATIDVYVGDYAAAREKFQKSLEIKQEIGNRAGEAATFFQLGALAWELGRLVEGARLVALCYLIDQSIGHGDTESDFRNLTAMASQLNYTQEQFDSMLQQVDESYQADRGQSLLRDAFGDG